MTETNNTKKQFIIFLLMAYGVTYLMGILIWYGTTVSADLSAFGNAQMFYPAAGVMLAYLLTKWEDGIFAKMVLSVLSAYHIADDIDFGISDCKAGPEHGPEWGGDFHVGYPFPVCGDWRKHSLLDYFVDCRKKEERFMDSDGSV